MFPVGGPGPRGASREPAGEPPVRPRPRPRGTSRWRNTPGPAGNLRLVKKTRGWLYVLWFHIRTYTQLESSGIYQDLSKTILNQSKSKF